MTSATSSAVTVEIEVQPNQGNYDKQQLVNKVLANAHLAVAILNQTFIDTIDGTTVVNFPTILVKYPDEANSGNQGVTTNSGQGLYQQIDQQPVIVQNPRQNQRASNVTTTNQGKNMQPTTSAADDLEDLERFLIPHATNQRPPVPMASGTQPHNHGNVAPTTGSTTQPNVTPTTQQGGVIRRPQVPTASQYNQQDGASWWNTPGTPYNQFQCADRRFPATEQQPQSYNLTNPPLAQDNTLTNRAPSYRRQPSAWPHTEGSNHWNAPHDNTGN
jgi:hypothetical protein